MAALLGTCGASAQRPEAKSALTITTLGEAMNLPPEIRSLCAKLAHQETVAATKRATAAHRAEAQRRLAAGEDPAAVVQNLKKRVARATLDNLPS